MTSAEIALALFALCNSVRVFAYVPQIIAVARDPGGASAISYTTWGLFAVSHLSTVAYAILTLSDWRMAAVFVANALCCLVIVGVTAWKRALFRAAQRLLESADACTLSSLGGGKAQKEREAEHHARSEPPHFLVVAGGKDAAVQLR
jgi:hypothetical protein